MVVTLSGGCSDSSADRYSYHVSLQSRTFGEDERTTTTISPGYVSSSCPEGIDADICVWASGPLPGVRVANGRSLATSVTIYIENVGVEPNYSVVQTRLFAREEQAQSCVDRDKAPAVEIAGQSGQFIALTIPACRALVLKQEVSPDKTSYRVGVAGELSLNVDSLARFIDEIAVADPPWDFVALLGNTRISGVSNVPSALKAAVRTSQVPIGVGLGDYEIERGYVDYLERFGATDYVTSIGLARLLALDTATRTLSDRQIRFIEDIERDDCNEECPAGAVLTWTSPLGPTSAERRGFQSQFVAQSTIATLDERGFDLLACGAYGGHGDETLGDVTAHPIGKGSAADSLATIAFEGVGRTTRACFNPREPRATPQLYPAGTEFRCADSEICVGGICREACRQDSDCALSPCFDDSYCRQTCESEADCPTSSACVAGWCRLSPNVEFSR